MDYFELVIEFFRLILFVISMITLMILIILDAYKYIKGKEYDESFNRRRFDITYRLIENLVISMCLFYNNTIIFIMYIINTIIIIGITIYYAKIEKMEKTE